MGSANLSMDVNILFNFQRLGGQNGGPQSDKLHLEKNFGAEMQDELIVAGGTTLSLSTVPHMIKTGSVGCSIEAGPVARAGILPMCAL